MSQGMGERKGRDHQAFTLIELLVVIAIIALLIAILLPSLEAARRQAKQNACLSHIKNIATSSRTYEADDPSGWSIPVHPLQYKQCPEQEQGGMCPNPTFIGAYEWGGKSGIGKNDFVARYTGRDLGSKYGTAAGFGPATRPLNQILYPGGITDNGSALYPSTFNRPGAEADTKLEMELFKCPGDNGPPRGAHCPDWVQERSRSSYDHFGNSYAANIFMTASGQSEMRSNSPYLRPTSRVPAPARTLYYEENIGRWAWSARNELTECHETVGGPGVDPGPTKAVSGWHGKDWWYNRAFVDAHAEYQKIYIEGTEDANGYANHYRNEQLDTYPSFMGDGVPGSFREFQCIIVRGDGWQKDTMPAPPLGTNLINPTGGRPSYEGCVDAEAAD